MTVVLQGKKSIHLGAQAFLVDDSKEVASSSWAKDAMTDNPAYKWVVGRFVEADNANRNGQLWSHDDLVMANPSIKYSPMNMLHQSKNIVGSFVGSEMIYPKEDQAQVANAYIEALGVFWKAYHPEAYAAVQQAHSEGKLFYSMECVSKSIQFSSPDGASKSDIMDYAGTKSETYGEWNNVAGAIRHLIEPHFLGGALIIPPVSPGWANAEITDLASFMRDNSEKLDEVYKQVASEHSHLSDNEVEAITLELLQRTSDSASSEDSIISDSTPKSIVVEELIDNEVSNDENNNLSEGGDMTTYSQEQVDAMIAEAVAPMQAELETLKAQAEAEAVDSQIASLKEQFDAEVAEVRAQLDAKVLEVEAAQNKYDEIVAWLEGEAAAAVEAAELAERLEARVAAVAEVANFPESYVEANAQRWAGMDDEAFAGLLGDYATVAETASAKGGNTSDTKIPATTALTSSRETAGAGRAVTSQALSGLRHVDFSTL